MQRKPIDMIFHIGLERTGTTSLQKAYTSQAKRLRARGVLYPTSSLAFEKFNHGPLAAAYLPETTRDDIFLRPCKAGRDAVLASLRAEIEASNAHTVLLSSEYFSSRFSGVAVGQLAQDFAADRCRIVLVLRDHLTRLTSAYATHVASGSTDSFEQYVDAMLHPDSHQIRYRRLLERWQSAFGAANVSVVTYGGNDILARLFAQLGLTAGIEPAGLRRYNRSLNVTGTEAIRRINKTLLTLRKDRAALPAESVIRLLLKWSAGFLEGKSAHWVLSRRRQTLLAELIEADRVWLATQGIVLSVERTLATCVASDAAAVALRNAEAGALADRLQFLFRPYLRVAEMNVATPASGVPDMGKASPRLL